MPVDDDIDDLQTIEDHAKLSFELIENTPQWNIDLDQDTNKMIILMITVISMRKLLLPAIALITTIK